MPCSGGATSPLAALPASCLVQRFVGGPAGGARNKIVNMAPPGRLPWEILDVDEEEPYVSPLPCRAAVTSGPAPLRWFGVGSAPRGGARERAFMAFLGGRERRACSSEGTDAACGAHAGRPAPASNPACGDGCRPFPMPQVNWGVDLTEGKAADPWKNAQLSSAAKDQMWLLHSKQG